MEGNGGHFGPFLSSPTCPGRAHDAFWKLTGRGDANAAFRRSVPRERPAGGSIGRESKHSTPSPFPRGFRHKLLKRLDSEKEMKGNERNSPCFTGVSRIQTASERLLERPICRRRARCAPVSPAPPQVAGKSRRNGLKTFISRRKVVSPRQPWTPNIWCWARAAARPRRSRAGPRSVRRSLTARTCCRNPPARSSAPSSATWRAPPTSRG